MHRSTMQRSVMRGIRKTRVVGSLAWLAILLSGDVCAMAQSPVLPAFDRVVSSSQPDQLLAGSLLLTELNCTACHQTPLEQLQPRRAPRLDALGHRVTGQWLKAFLQDPAAARPGTSMPRMLGELAESDRNDVIDALMAYLGSLREPYVQPTSTASNPIAFEFWNKGDPDRGRILFHQVGCVACHEFDADYQAGSQPRSPLDDLIAQLDPEELAEMGLSDQVRPVPSVPLNRLAARHTRESLTHFLLDPASIRPAGRMPAMKLTPAEAADLAAWLVRSADESGERDSSGGRAIESQVPTASSASLIALGARYFQEFHCTDCHPRPRGTEAAKAPAATALDQLNASSQQSCLSVATGKLPVYRLSTRQVDSLKQVLENLSSAGQELADSGRLAQLKLHQLNCIACHERAGRGGVGVRRRAFFETEGDVDLGDEGRLPPPLDGVGRKLFPAALQNVLMGKGDIRPHMQARMPVFPQDKVAALPALLAKADDARDRKADDVFGQVSGLAAAGRELMDVGCVQCHPFNGERLPGVIGIDLATVRGRIRPDWLRQFLLNPTELKSRTRMPTFFPNGKTATPSILEGRVDRQLAAMWAYLSDIEQQPLPQKLLDGRLHDFEIIPETQPVVLRTFMRKAGPQAIAVGFPIRVHYAFDAEQLRLAQIWRGRFLDAHGTWYDRFTPPADPLGSNPVDLPDGSFVARFSQHDAAWPKTDLETTRFRGYRLDTRRVPTLSYRVNVDLIEERIEPVAANELVRTVRIEHSGGDRSTRLWARLWSGANWKQVDQNTIETGNGIRISCESNPPAQPAVVRDADRRDWRLAIPDEPTRLTIRYRWSDSGP